MKKHLLKLLLLAFILFNFNSLKAQGNIPTVGTDFWLGFLSNYSGSSESLDLFLSGTQATSGTISSPLQGWSTTFNITPGQTTTVTIPEWVGGNYVDDAVSNKALHIESDDTIAVFAINFRSYSADGTLVLPIKSLGTDYIVSTYEGIYGESEFGIVATADGTEVEITPSAPTTGGHPAGVPYIVQLNAGQTYQVKTATDGDLTGSKIVATEASGDCRPFAVFSGVVCANIPVNCTACDHIYDQNYPIDTWGKKYYVAPFLNSSTYTFRIIAREDNTTVTLDNGSQITLNAGQFTNYNSVTTDQVISADKPIAVIQYMEGVTCAGSGDPAMLILNSEERKIDDITFSTVTSTVITTHTVNIIVESAATSSVLLDGALINSSEFTAFNADPLKSYARLNLVQGSHNISLGSGFTAYAYGAGNAESYAYGVGSFLPEVQIPVDTAYCTSDSIVLSVAGIFNPWWSTTTNPSDTIHEGFTLVLHPPIVNDIYVVTGSSLVSGCQYEKVFSVESPTPPVISVTSSEDSVCFFENVQFNVDVTPISASYTYLWEPTYLFDDYTASNPSINVQNSGWYKVTVSSLTGCSSSTDSVYLTVIGGSVGGIKEVHASSDINLICVPDTAQLNLDIVQVIQFDDFDGGNNSGLWSAISGGINTDTCESISGDALYFNGDLPSRFAETNDFDLSDGGELEFYLKIANGVVPCDNADAGENVILEYSTDAGGAWNNVATYFENLYPNLTLINVAVPLAAQTSATRFRWRQAAFTALDEDVWVLENVSVSSNSSSGVSISWSPSSLSDPSIANPLAFPNQPTLYIATVTSGVCDYQDSVYINAGNAFTLQTTDDVSLCSITPVDISSVPDLAGNYTYAWSPNLNLSSTNSQTVTSNTITTTMYYVTVSSDFGCQVQDSVQIYFASQTSSVISGDTSICVGDTSNLEVILTSNLSDDFNTVYNTDLWSTIGGGLLNTSCGAVSGDALHFNSASGTRYAQTVALNTSSGGNITFSLIIGSGSSPCEDADAGENIILEYSTNNGLNWTTIDTYLTTAYSSFTAMNVAIPAGAMTASTLFRWNQPNSSGTGSDNWAIDDVSINISSSSTSNFSVEWKDENNQIVSTNLVLGYTPSVSTMLYVTLTDTIANCQTQDSVYLIVNTFSLEAGNDTLLCPGSPMQLHAVTSLSNPTINWTNSSNLNASNTLDPTVIQDISQYYTLTVTQGTCTGKDSVQVSYYQQPSLIDTNAVNICANDTFNLHLASGTNYSWDNTATMLNETSSDPQFIPQNFTLYIVNYEYGNACQNSDSIQITVVAIPEMTLIDTMYKCPENSVTISPVYTNVDQVLWSNSQQTTDITVSQAGLYIVDGTNLCKTISDSVYVIDYEVDQVNIGVDTTLCYYTSLDVFPVNLDPNTTFVWSNNDPDLVQSLSGTNTISIITNDINSCKSYDTLTLSVFPILNVSLGPDIAFCSYDDVVLQLNNPNLIDFFWNTGDTSETITINEEGNYIVLTHDNNACSYSDTIFVDEILAPFPVIAGDLEYCPGGNVSLGLTTVYSSYTWSTGENTQTISAGAPLSQIWVEVRNQYNCVGSDTIYIVERILPDLDLGPDYFICPQEFTELSAFIPSGTNYQWSTNQTSPIINVGPGTYDVQTFYTNCVLRDTITIFPKELPVLEIGESFVICPDGEISINPLALHYDSLVWSNGQQGLPFVFDGDILMFDTISISATAYGCGEVSDTLGVYVENCNCIIYVPNTFTPDGNDFNNTFHIVHLCDFITFGFTVVDRWGEIIFQTNNPNFEWDGTGPDGSILQDGTYSWSMTYQSTEDDTMINENGFVLILH